MKQHSLGLGATAKRTRRREFLDEMGRVVPWGELVALVTPYLPEGKRGRPPFAPETMLRIHFMQQWFNLSDPAMEEALHDVPLFREFAGLGTWDERLPDESTILRFRHVLEKHKLAPQMLQTVNDLLATKGLLLKSGTVVDATLIAAPSSTKNASGERDPQMKQSRKGQQWYFGMKAHIGVDSKTKLIHSVVATSANVHDKHPIPQLLHGNENRVYGDSAYASQKALIGQAAPRAKDFTNQKASRHKPLTEREREKNRRKSQVRAKVEHAFLVIKRVFGFAKVAYRGLAKNGNRLFVVAALANLFMARHHLFRVQGDRCVQ